MAMTLNELDKVEILTLQDNYVDLIAGDNNDVVSRAMPIKDMELKNSIMAEHGFSSLITVTKNNVTRSMLFDFGFSNHGAAFNADALDIDLSQIEVLALSHGHMDHFGGLAELVRKVGKKKIDLVVHPDVFRASRSAARKDGLKIKLPGFTREATEEAGVNLIETRDPYPLLEDDVLFLGEIPRITTFETGAPNLFYDKNGEEAADDLSDDTSLVLNIKGKGLVVLSGCAHSGIINTINYAKEVAGVDDVLAVMGGFHLSGPDMAPLIKPTIETLKKINPKHVIPTHCTGREAIMQIELEMLDQFILNMVGTKLSFF